MCEFTGRAAVRCCWPPAERPTIVSTRSSDTIPGRGTILVKPIKRSSPQLDETNPREESTEATLPNIPTVERCRMRLLTPLTVFVIAIITTQARTDAADNSVPPDKLKTVSTASSTGVSQQYGENGFDEFRQQADLGAPGSPGFGFKHFPYRMHMFTTWHRPRAATLTKCQRCAPDDFRPRGLGHLFARPCDSFRMEYAPHILQNPQSQYGPAYLYRQGDPRCDHCNH